MKRIASALALILLSSAALAQTTPNSSADAQANESGTAGARDSASSSSSTSSSNAIVLVPIEADETPVPALNLMVDQVDDMRVIGADDKVIGEIDEVLGDQNGEPQAIVVEAGGFLGMGERRIILMMDQVELDMGRLRTALTESEISDLPEYQG